MFKFLIKGIFGIVEQKYKKKNQFNQHLKKHKEKKKRKLVKNKKKKTTSVKDWAHAVEAVEAVEAVAAVAYNQRSTTVHPTNSNCGRLVLPARYESINKALLNEWNEDHGCMAGFDHVFFIIQYLRAPAPPSLFCSFISHYSHDCTPSPPPLFFYSILLCHIIMPFYYATLLCHFIMPHYYAILLCHIIMPFYYATLLHRVSNTNEALTANSIKQSPQILCCTTFRFFTFRFASESVGPVSNF